MSALFPTYEESIESITKGRADILRMRDEAMSRILKDRAAIESYDELIGRMDNKIRIFKQIVSNKAGQGKTLDVTTNK